MKKKPGIIILFFALALIIGFIASGLLSVYLEMNKEIITAKKSPRTGSPGMVSEYEAKPCWISGTIKADGPAELLVSRGTERPCVYYSYTSEYATYDSDSEKSWHVSEQDIKLAGIPFTVQDRRYRFVYTDLQVTGGLVKTLDLIEKRDNTEYRYTEYIIPDGASLWVFGIPGKETIGQVEKKLIITMTTPEEFIREITTTAVFVLVLDCVFFCITVLFIAFGVWNVMKRN